MNMQVSIQECPLSPREMECVKWAANGKTSEETAVIMGTTRASVTACLHRAGKRLDTYGKTAVVVECFRKGWLR